MSIKNSKTTCSGMEWNTLLGLLHRLKTDKQLRDYIFIAIGSYFGLRAKDILSLRWRDILNRDEFVIVESKTKKKRSITINSYVKNAIRFVADELTKEGKLNIDAYVFANRSGDKISIQYINRRLDKVFKQYNVRVQNGSTHTLRKTFGKRVWEMDAKSERSLIYLSEIFSHSSISTTKRYIGIIQKDIENIYLNL